MGYKDPVDYVNPYIGSIGHLLTSTSPIVSQPHGMAQVIPVMNPGVTDRYLADQIHGFRVGCTILMPYIFDNQSDSASCTSSFDHDLETATPYFYSVLLEDSEIRTEYTALSHSASFRIVYSKGTDARILIQLPMDAEIEVLHEQAIIGQTTIDNVPHQVYIEISNSFIVEGTWTNGTATGVIIAFSDSAEEMVIELKIGISHLGADQARPREA